MASMAEEPKTKSELNPRSQQTGSDLGILGHPEIEADLAIKECGAPAIRAILRMIKFQSIQAAISGAGFWAPIHNPPFISLPENSDSEVGIAPSFRNLVQGSKRLRQVFGDPNDPVRTAEGVRALMEHANQFSSSARLAEIVEELAPGEGSDGVIPSHTRVEILWKELLLSCEGNMEDREEELPQIDLILAFVSLNLDCKKSLGIIRPEDLTRWKSELATSTSKHAVLLGSLVTAPEVREEIEKICAVNLRASIQEASLGSAKAFLFSDEGCKIPTPYTRDDLSSLLTLLAVKASGSTSMNYDLLEAFKLTPLFSSEELWLTLDTHTISDLLSAVTETLGRRMFSVRRTRQPLTWDRISAAELMNQSVSLIKQKKAKKSNPKKKRDSEWKWEEKENPKRHQGESSYPTKNDPGKGKNFMFYNTKGGCGYSKFNLDLLIDRLHLDRPHLPSESTPAAGSSLMEQRKKLFEEKVAGCLTECRDVLRDIPADKQQEANSYVQKYYEQDLLSHGLPADHKWISWGDGEKLPSKINNPREFCLLNCSTSNCSKQYGKPPVGAKVEGEDRQRCGRFHLSPKSLSFCQVVKEFKSLK